MRRLHPAVWLGLLLMLTLIVRTRMEHSRVLAKAEEARDVEQQGVLYAEAARWAWPFGAEREEHLNRALTLSRSIRGDNPNGARAIAEEVRATLYAVRTGSPGHPELMGEANQIIVEELAKRDRLTSEALDKLTSQYEKELGPSPGASLLSSIGFLFWLIGLGIAIWAKDRKRQIGVLVSLAGLGFYLGFLTIA